MSLDPDTITQHLDLLAAYRRTLAHLLQQAAAFGGEVFAPPQTASGIAESRANIGRIKATLRKNSVQVEDAPNDKAPRRRKPTQAHQAGDVVAGDRVGGDKVGGDKVMGDKRIITTEGGDYAEGNIDKWQGAFISGGTVQGNVVGTNLGIVTANYYSQQAVPLSPALHQLRAPVGDFVGRTDEIDQLVSALTKRGRAAAISGVRGMGGIGKTELAYAAVQRLADLFPDAQLLVELRGASASSLTPEAALQTVIRAFEREAKLPDNAAQLIGVYNSVLSGKRVLILADDAKDAAQVRALLPPPGCALLVTSRNRFGLPGMTAIDLGTLPPEEAENLLLEICPRIGTHAKELAKLCGYLPLALRVSASLLEVNDTRSVPHYLEQLAAEQLKQLSDPDDPTASVEASLQLSYDALEPAAQRALCQMSVFPASFDAAAAQEVVEIAGDVTKALELLRRRSLLDWDENTERYSLHDLVRTFAAARLEDASAVRFRYARHYAQMAQKAVKLYNQRDAQLMTGLMLFDREQAHIHTGWAWASQQKASSKTDFLLLDYAESITFFGDIRYRLREERILWTQVSLDAARRLDFKEAETVQLNNLGWAYAAQNDFRQAIDYYKQSIAISHELGDLRLEEHTLSNLGSAYLRMGEKGRATECFAQALTIARNSGNRSREIFELGKIGDTYFAQGNANQAIEYHKQYLAATREQGDQPREAHALLRLGLDYTALKQADDAIVCYEQALAIRHSLGDRRTEGRILYRLGRAYANRGELQRAISSYEESISVAREVGNREIEAYSCWNLGLIYERQHELARAAELMQIYVNFERELGRPDAKKHAAYLKELREHLTAQRSSPAASQESAPADDADQR